MKKLFWIFALTFTFSANSFAIDIDYDFPPNHRQKVKNYLFWQTRAKCTIYTPDKADVLQMLALSGTSYVNGQHLAQGEVVYLNVQNRQLVEISMTSRAEFEVLNLGVNTVVASCSYNPY